MSGISQTIRSIVNHDGGVILDLEHGAMLTLNSTGAYVWDKVQRGELIDRVVRELAQETCTDLATVDRDVREFVALLRTRNLFRA